MIYLTALFLILFAWASPMVVIANMDRMDKTEKMFWFLSVLPFSWFAVIALMMSGPVMSGQKTMEETSQYYR